MTTIRQLAWRACSARAVARPTMPAPTTTASTASSVGTGAAAGSTGVTGRSTGGRPRRAGGPGSSVPAGPFELLTTGGHLGPRRVGVLVVARVGVLVGLQRLVHLEEVADL